MDSSLLDIEMSACILTCYYNALFWNTDFDRHFTMNSMFSYELGICLDCDQLCMLKEKVSVCLSDRSIYLNHLTDLTEKHLHIIIIQSPSTKKRPTCANPG